MPLNVLTHDLSCEYIDLNTVNILPCTPSCNNLYHNMEWGTESKAREKKYDGMCVVRAAPKDW